MINPKIVSESPMTFAEAKEALESIKERDKEFSFRSGKTYDYLTSVHTDEGKKTNDMIKKIEELNIPRLKKEQIAKLVDLKPCCLEEIKVILQGATVTAENFKKIESVIVKDAE